MTRPEPKLTRSPLQQALVDWAITEPSALHAKHCIVVARAGCGKTTSIIEIVVELVAKAKRRGQRISIFVGAFNKKIAVEIEQKLKKLGIDWRDAGAGTMHSAGKRLWLKSNPHCVVDEHKISKILEKLALTEPNGLIYTDCGSQIEDLVGFAKNSAFGCQGQVSINDDAAWANLIDHYAIDFSEEYKQHEIIEAAKKVLLTSYKQDNLVIDFDDMIYAPVAHRAAVRWPFDWVIIDEAQDTNPIRRLLATMLLRPGTGRSMWVGDDRQAIYGFTGADASALDIIQRQLNAVKLPLNVTYRCPKLVVREANNMVPDLIAHESAPQGIVSRVNLDEQMKTAVETFKETDAILCRKTAPLIELVYRLIRLRIPARVEGREIGKGLLASATRWKRIKELGPLKEKLDEVTAKQVAKLAAKKGNEQKIEALQDKTDTIKTLCDICMADSKHSIEDLKLLINQMFTDTEKLEKPMLTLSTVHKSKGREWDRVFVLGRNEYMPSKAAKQDWEFVQEDNLIYVAVTRAKRELVYLDV